MCIYQSLACKGVGGLTCLGSSPASVRIDATRVVSTLPSAATQLALSRAHGCARSDELSIVCWGADTYGQVSNAPLVGKTVSVNDVASCALTSSTNVSCSGDFQSVLYNGSSSLCDTALSPSLIFVVDGVSTSICGVNGSDFYPFPSGGSAARLGERSNNFRAIRSVSVVDPPPQTSAQCTISRSGGSVCPSFNGGVDLSPQLSPMLAFLDVCSGAAHACGLLSNMSILCWGPSSTNQFAWSIAATGFPLAPAPFYDISCGVAHSCAIDANRNVVCWGDSVPDAHPNILPSVLPSSRSSFVRGWAADSLCLMDPTGRGGGDLTFSCYSNGWTGRPSLIQSSSAAFGTIVSFVYLGPTSACYFRNLSGSVSCWGDGFAARPSSVPFSTTPTGTPLTLSISYQHACIAAVNASTLECWGDPDFNRFSGASPTFSMPWNISAISLGFGHSCVVESTNSSLWCWGSNTATIAAPFQLVRADNTVAAGPFSASTTSVCSGKWFVCAFDISSSPLVRCFNMSVSAFPEITFLPPQVTSPGGAIILACGEYHVCTVSLAFNTLLCAAVTTRPELIPSAALAIPSSGGSGWRDVSCGRAHTCGITVANTLLCWGDTSWQQGPARIVPKYPISTPTDPAFDNRVVLVGVAGSSNAACFANKTCATLAQAATLFTTPRTVFWAVSNLTIDAQVIFGPFCDQCTLSSHPNLTAVSNPAWITVQPSMNKTISAYGGSSSAAILIQSTMSLSNLVFTSGASGAAPPISSSVVLLSSIIQVQSPRVFAPFSLKNVSFYNIAPPVSSTVPNMSALTSIVRVATKGSATFSDISISGPGTSTLRFLDVISAPSVIIVSNVSVDGSSGGVSSMSGSAPQPLFSVAGGAYTCQVSALTLINRQTPLAPVLSHMGSSTIELFAMRIDSSVFTAALSAANALSISVSSLFVSNSSFQSVVHAPFDAFAENVGNASISISAASVSNCTIGGPALPLAATAAASINGSAVLGIFLNRPLVSPLAVLPLDTITLSSNSLSSTGASPFSTVRTAVVANNTSFASLSVDAFNASINLNGAASVDFLVCIQLASQAAPEVGAASSSVTISGATQEAPTQMRLLSLSAAPATKFPATWTLPDTAVFLSSINWNWQRPIIASPQQAAAFDSSVVVLLDVPAAAVAITNVIISALNSTAPLFAPACGLICARILPPSAFVGGGVGVGSYTILNTTLSGGFAQAGGALYWSSPQQSSTFALSITASTIYGSVAAGASGGGGIFVASSAASVVVTVLNTTIASCAASAGSGGGMSIVADSGSSSLRIGGSIFSKNTAALNGGGVSLSIVNSQRNVTSSSLSVSKSSFSGNNASSGGGLFASVVDSNLAFTTSSSVFSGNTAGSPAPSPALTSVGGAYTIVSTTVTSEKIVVVNATHADNVFTGNRARDSGGAIAYQHDGILRFVASGDVLVSNAAEVEDGGAFWHGPASTPQFFTALLKLYNVSATGNSAAKNGGTFSTSSASMEATNFQSAHNTAGSGGVGDGGSIHMLGGNSNVTSSSFTSDFASGSGGSLALFASSSPHAISDTIFAGGAANTTDGGCIVIDGSAISIANGSFASCSSGTNGGAIAVRGNSKLTLSDSLVNACVAYSSGGALSAVNALALTISDVTISSCNASITGGGGISIASAQPGSLYTLGPALQVLSCFASGAAGKGGGLYLSGVRSSALSLAPSTNIDRCSAASGGGVALLGGSSFPSGLSADIISITNNYAITAGGAVFSDDTGFSFPPSLTAAIGAWGNTVSAAGYSPTVATPPTRIIDVTDPASIAAITSGIAPYSPTPLSIFTLGVADNFNGIIPSGTSFTCVTSATVTGASTPVFLRNASTFKSNPSSGKVDVSWIGFAADGGTLIDVVAMCTLQANANSVRTFSFARSIRLTTLVIRSSSPLPTTYIPSLPSANWTVGGSGQQIQLTLYTQPCTSGVAGSICATNEGMRCTLKPLLSSFVIYSVDRRLGDTIFAGGFPAAPAVSSVVTVPSFGIQSSEFAPVDLQLSCFRPAENDAYVILPFTLYATKALSTSFSAPPQSATSLQTTLSPFSVSILAGGPSALAGNDQPGFPETSCVVTASFITSVPGFNASKDVKPVPINGIVAVDASSGTALFDQFILSAGSGIYDLSFACSIGGSIVIPPILTSSLTVSGCDSGLTPQGTQCGTCPIGTFTIGGAGVSIACATCPPTGATCSSGKISLQSNFFRPPQQNGLALGPDTELHACLNGEACTLTQPTNMTNAMYGCTAGYIGPLCGVCDAANNYALFGQVCATCWPVWQTNLLLIGATLAIIAGLVFLALKTGGSETNAGDERGAAAPVAKRTSADAGGSSPPSSSDASIALRIAMSYLQSLGSLKTFVSGGTAAYRSLMGWTDTVSSSPLSSGAFSCALAHPSFLAKYMSTIFIPAILTAGVVAIFLLVQALRSLPSLRICLCGRQRNAVASSFLSQEVNQPQEEPKQLELPSKQRSRRSVVASIRTQPPHTDESMAPSSFSPIEGASAAAVNPLRVGISSSASDLQPPLPPSPPPSFINSVKSWFAERRHISTFVFFLSLFYMAITSSSFRVLDCMSSEPIYGVVYLRRDLRVICYVGAHAVGVAFAYMTLLFVGVGFPLGFFLLLSRATPEQLASISFRSAYGFLFRGYRPMSAAMAAEAAALESGRASTVALSAASRKQPRASFASAAFWDGSSSRRLGIQERFKALVSGHLLWWEAVVITRKAGVVLLSVLVTNAYLQNAGAALWFAGALSLQLYVQPYEKPLFNFLEAVSLVASFTTAVIASTLLQYDVTNPTFITQAPSDMSSLEWAITGLLATINFTAMAIIGCAWLWLLFSGAFNRLASLCGFGAGNRETGCCSSPLRRRAVTSSLAAAPSSKTAPSLVVVKPAASMGEKALPLGVKNSEEKGESLNPTNPMFTSPTATLVDGGGSSDSSGGGCAPDSAAAMRAPQTSTSFSAAASRSRASFAATSASDQECVVDPPPVFTANPAKGVVGDGGGQASLTSRDLP